MRILQIHNYYQQPGGEDSVVQQEKELLESHHHEVHLFSKSNGEIDSYTLAQKIALLKNTTWSKESYTEVMNKINSISPDICHVHNILPLMSPSIYYACKENNVPVVQTLHNYRLLCTNGYLFRDGQVCEECVGVSTYHSLKYACYRDSYIQNYAVARMLEKHRKMDNWSEKIDAYIALTDFAAAKFVEGGLPREKIFIKPNFVRGDGSSTETETGDYVLFSGRLDGLKGSEILNEALKKLPDVQCKIAGSGELETALTAGNIELLGWQSEEELKTLMKNSLAMVFPSKLYENLPMVVVEAFASSKPVIASNHGAMAELIEDGKNGLLFTPGDANDLADKIRWAYEHREEMMEMGRNARKEYELKYTPERNYEMLMDIYSKTAANYQSS